MLLSEIPDNYDYLAHHGIKGQKWGIRRYQKYDGTLTKLGRKRLGIGESRKQQRQEAKAKKKMIAEEEKLAAAKRKLRDEMVRNPKKLFNNRDSFTKEEIDSIMKDIEFNRKIKDIQKSDRDRILNDMQQIVDFSKKTSDLLSNAKSVYNLYAEVYNTFNKDGKKKLKIGEKPEGDSKEEWKKLLMSSDPKALLANSNKLTNEQLKDLNSRVTTLSQINKNLYPENDKKTENKTVETNQNTANKPKTQNDYEYIDKITKNGETRYLYEDERGNVSSFSSNSNVLKSSASMKINELPKTHTLTSDWYKTAAPTNMDNLPGLEREKKNANIIKENERRSKEIKHAEDRIQNARNNFNEVKKQNSKKIEEYDKKAKDAEHLEKHYKNKANDARQVNFDSGNWRDETPQEYEIKSKAAREEAAMYRTRIKGIESSEKQLRSNIQSYIDNDMRLIDTLERANRSSWYR